MLNLELYCLYLHHIFTNYKLDKSLSKTENHDKTNINDRFQTIYDRIQTI